MLQGLQGTVQKLEEECESLQAQAHRGKFLARADRAYDDGFITERSQLMNQINSIESQVHQLSLTCTNPDGVLSAGECNS